MGAPQMAAPWGGSSACLRMRLGERLYAPPCDSDSLEGEEVTANVDGPTTPSAFFGSGAGTGRLVPSWGGPCTTCFRGTLTSSVDVASPQ
jgi:hypothetical protein